MSRLELLQKGLWSVHAIIIKARYMAYQEESQEKIATLLDDGDYLTSLLLDESRSPDKIESVLTRIGKEHNYYLPLERFRE